MTKQLSFTNLSISRHPLVADKLSKLRRKDTEPARFRKNLEDLSYLLAYELTSELATANSQIETPLGPMEAPFIEHQDGFVITPILRAGLCMTGGLEMFLPDAQIAHIGVYRHKETKQAMEYLVTLPEIKNQIFIVVDPMLATGNSAIHALNVLTREGVKPKNILFMSLLAAPEGVQALVDSYPDVKIFAAALDEKLNDQAYILPGLGDAGDRAFGTT
jgi:uracil phosphoribosyltransferase